MARMQRNMEFSTQQQLTGFWNSSGIFLEEKKRELWPAWVCVVDLKIVGPPFSFIVGFLSGEGEERRRERAMDTAEVLFACGIGLPVTAYLTWNFATFLAGKTYNKVSFRPGNFAIFFLLHTSWNVKSKTAGEKECWNVKEKHWTHTGHCICTIILPKNSTKTTKNCFHTVSNDSCSWKMFSWSKRGPIFQFRRYLSLD